MGYSLEPNALYIRVRWVVKRLSKPIGVGHVGSRYRGDCDIDS
jgi:hypothetical protein